MKNLFVIAAVALCLTATTSFAQQTEATTPKAAKKEVKADKAKAEKKPVKAVKKEVKSEKKEEKMK
jgi:hypothetical protein